DPPQEMNPEIVQGPGGNQETYRVHLPGAGSFRCSETELGFEVRAAVTVQYRYDSWDQHLSKWSTPEWLVIGPLFNIQAEPATAVAAVHLPHFLCLAGGQTDISQMRIIHFTDEGMTLEEPTGVRPSHVVLENPSFSLYGVIFICLSCLRIPVHSLVLIYQALRLADTTLHLYLIPNDCSLEKAIGKHEEKRRSVSVDKSPQTNEPLYFGTDYTVCCSSEAEITPKKLTFSYTSRENRQPFVEVYIEEMKGSVQLSVTESSSGDPHWETTLRPGDVKREEPVPEDPTASPKKHFVDQHREELIQRVTAVDCILDKLYDSVLNNEQCQRVKSESTNPDKMRKLYELVVSWDNKCKNQFYDVLKTTHRHLVEELEGK
ncbi:NLR family pyrin domain containing 1, partial [Chelydra serpentina]